MDVDLGSVKIAVGFGEGMPLAGAPVVDSMMQIAHWIGGNVLDPLFWFIEQEEPLIFR